MAADDPSKPIRLVALEAEVFRAPIGEPVRTAFGVMRDRPAVLVRAVADDDAEGWGEVWCNFPSVGAEHRARLVREVVAPLALGRDWLSPEAAFAALSAALETLAIQSGEPGPVSQALAGLDMALWDLAARRAGRPLYRMFRDAALDRVPVYASGLNPDGPERLAAERRAEGHRAFKLKVGFGRERDLANLRALRDTLGENCTLMIDANQGWDVATALAMAPLVAPFGLAWLEEPLRADAPDRDWQALAGATPVPIAAGENLRGAGAFEAAIRGGWLRVVQPDIAKWGGFSGCVAVARKARAAGLRFCPHWLGGGVGLAASLHLLAAVGGDGLAEVDANPNPLRSLMAPGCDAVRDGAVALPQSPGLGFAPDRAALAAFRVGG